MIFRCYITNDWEVVDRESFQQNWLQAHSNSTFNINTSHTHFVVGTHFILQNGVHNPTWSIGRGMKMDGFLTGMILYRHAKPSIEMILKLCVYIYILSAEQNRLLRSSKRLLEYFWKHPYTTNQCPSTWLGENHPGLKATPFDHPNDPKMKYLC